LTGDRVGQRVRPHSSDQRRLEWEGARGCAALSLWAPVLAGWSRAGRSARSAARSARGSSRRACKGASPASLMYARAASLTAWVHGSLCFAHYHGRSLGPALALPATTDSGWAPTVHCVSPRVGVHDAHHSATSFSQSELMHCSLAPATRARRSALRIWSACAKTSATNS
jgi:hypothetical protein